MIDEPAWGFWEPEHADCEDYSGDHLQTPWDSEGCCTVDVGAAELDEVLDEDTPGDGPLL